MKTIFLMIATFITLISCNNTDNEFTPILPEATQTGENTFGCYIDGKLLTPRDGTGTFNSPDNGMRFWALGDPPNYLYNELTVKNFKNNGNRLDIHFVNLHTNGVGSFVINESNCENQLDANPSINIRIRWYDESQNIDKWYCSNIDAGQLTITRYDFENRVLSGTFSCSAKNKDDLNDTIEVTDGRFDIKWDTLEGTSFP